MTDPIERIDALTRNARNTWFALLSALLFVGVTLMGVEHIDFYGVDRATQLPLIGVSVPTPLFFYAAPLLTTAIYCYFHLYLIRLWDALGSAPARVNGTRLGDAISPWLLTDAALHLRRHLRRDNCTAPRAMEGASALVNFALSWGLGWAVLGYAWSQSLPARDLWMSQIAATCLAIAIICGTTSLAMTYRRLGMQDRATAEESHRIWSTIPAIFGLSALLLILPALTWQKTSGSTDQLAELDLSNQNVVERPKGWLPYDIARRDFLSRWCKREAPRCKRTESPPQAFEIEWQKRRTMAVKTLKKPAWAAPTVPSPDFRGANLTGAFMAGIDVRNGQFDASELGQADLEGANMQYATLVGADMRQAVLNHAKLDNAALSKADLRFANLTNASLHHAGLEEATLISATLIGTDFWSASMNGVDLSASKISRKETFANNLLDADLNGSTNHGGAIRNANLKSFSFDQDTDWRNVFLDGSVSLPFRLTKRLGEPCQWTRMVLQDEVFFGLWRGWVEQQIAAQWPLIAPIGWEDVTPIPPPKGCTWKTGPMPRWHGGGR